MSLDDGCMFCPRRRRRQRRRRRRRRLSFGPAMFFRGCDSDLRREKRDENPSKQCGAATTQDQRATSCWTISIADHHRRRGVRMMAMMPAIVRSREAASERASEQSRKVFDVPPSPLPSHLRRLSDDRNRGGRSRGPTATARRTDVRMRTANASIPSLNPSLSRSSRFFTPKCDRRSCLEGELHGIQRVALASATARRKTVSSPHL